MFLFRTTTPPQCLLHAPHLTTKPSKLLIPFSWSLAQNRKAALSKALMVWLVPLLGILGKLPGLVGEYFQKKQEIELKKLDADLEVQKENIKLASETAKAQFELNKTIVESTGSYFKYFTFAIWFGPFVIGTFCPYYGEQIFKNWAGMPEWYVNSIVAIMFTIWGIQVSAPVVANIFSSLSEFFKSRRQYKIEKIQAKALLNEKTLADSLRKSLFTKGMTQEQWDAILSAAKQSIED